MVTEPGERVYFHGHPSWLSMPGLYAKGAFGAFLAGVIAGLASAAASSGHVHDAWVVVAVLAVFVLVSLRGYARRARTTYTITDRRLRIGTGLLGRDVYETRLERVQNVSSRQSLLERLLGVGSIDFETAAGAEYDFSFRGVPEPHELARTVHQALHERERVGSSYW